MFNSCSVLFFQEELATIFKSVTLHEDALVQYDELDALFSQFVVNSQVRGKWWYIDVMSWYIDV